MSSYIAIILGVFNKTIIPLALVGYEIVIANSKLRPRWLSTISAHIQRALMNKLLNISRFLQFVRSIAKRCRTTVFFAAK